MKRILPLSLCCLMLAACSESPKDASKQDGSSARTTSDDRRPGAPEGSTSAGQAAFDFLAGSYRGSEVEILSSQEQAVTSPKTVATAIHVAWRIKGEEGTHNEILLIQSDRVVFKMDCNPDKSFAENVSAAVKQFEN